MLRDKPFCGRSAVRLLGGVLGTCWLTTSHEGNVCQVTEVKSIAELCAVLLPRPPGCGLASRTDGARERQVLADDISVFSPGSETFSGGFGSTGSPTCLPASRSHRCPGACPKDSILPRCHVRLRLRVPPSERQAPSVTPAQAGNENRLHERCS